jgi:pyruvate dehydrogenase E2 component (dihydrolipoamide acetyltransferase)
MSEFRMPSLGADMEAGTLVEWHKTAGDTVQRGDIVAVVDTQKGAIEIEIFESGVLTSILVSPGEKVPVGTVLAVVNGPTPTAREPEAAVAAAQPAPPPRTLVAPRPAPVLAPAAGERRRISPAARKRASELGVALDLVAGTGPDQAVTLADVERTALQPAPRPGAKTTPAEAMRQAIGAAMARSKREIPHYYLATTIDMTAAFAWLEATNAARPVTTRLIYGVLLLKAVALALRKVPELNGFWIDGRPQPGAAIHVGWAVSLRGGGLIAPAVHDVDRKPLDRLMTELRDLVQRARTGGLRSSELADSTITVTSLGEQAPESVFGIIYPPQVALVGFGAPATRPVVVDGSVVARPALQATLAGDHRASDGHRGGVFLMTLDKLLQRPEAL